MKGLQTSLFTRRGALAWAVLLVGVLLVGLVWTALQEQKARSAQQQFELHVREVVEAIQKRLRDHEQILLGGAGLFDAGNAVSRTAWRAYVERLQLKNNYPGIQGVGFSQVIRPEQLADHIAGVRAEGFSAYTVRPAGERPLYTSIVFLEPFAGRNLAAFGYDMFSQATRHKAMQEAVDNHATSISGKVKLIQETHGKPQAGFLMYVPVYRTGLPLTTAAERWQALMGFVYSPYRAEDLMRGILGQSHLDIEFSIHDGDTVSPDGLMYASADEHPSEENANPSFVTQRQVRAYGHAWTITLFSRPSFEARFVTPLDWLVPGLGVGIALSLFALTWTLLNRREQALELAQLMAEKRNESEERFHQLFLHMGQGVVVQQADGSISQANPAAERILGLSLDEMRGITSMDPRWRIIREDGSEFPGDAQPGMQALRQGKVVNGVVMGVWNPGEEGWRWISVDAYPSHEPGSGQVQEVYSVFSDITIQRAANLEMRQARKLLLDVLAAASEVSIIATDPKGMITIFNRGAERLLGYGAEEMVGRQTPATIHLAEEVVARGHELSAELGREVQGFRVFVEKPEREGSEKREWTYVRKDGSHFPVSLVVTAMRGNVGEIIGYLGIAEDITKRKQVEAALQASATHTQTILDNVLDGIVTIDVKGKVVSFNRAAERIFGYEAVEVIGQNVKMLMPEPHRSQHDGYLQNYRESRVAHILGIGREVDGQRKDGHVFPLELAVSEIERDGQPMYIGMVRDITERKRVEQMKSEFVSTVSHELRTPLTSIAGALKLMAGDVLGMLPDTAKPLMHIALRNSERLAHLINDLLDMEKIAAGKLRFDMQVQPLMPLVVQALEANKAYGEQFQVLFELTQSAEEAEVRVDAQRLLQVLANYLSNAAKFSPPHGRVEVSVHRLDNKVRVAVKDQGPGIPDEFRNRIFQKFSQADASDTRQKGGTGLGLAITKELAERMGGQVGFDSTGGEGATFHLDLPIVTAHQDVPTQACP